MIFYFMDHERTLGPRKTMDPGELQETEANRKNDPNKKIHEMRRQ